jgi:hypothetical protein
VPPPQFDAAGEEINAVPEKDPMEKAGYKILVRLD